MIAALLTIFLLFVPTQRTDQISDAQKKSFIELLGTLPHKGEFFTDEVLKKAAPYLPVLFALNEKDIEKYDIYAFGALSRGLCDQRQHRAYATRHFLEIRHPELKLFWGAMLFDAGSSSPEIGRFLREALTSEKQSKILAELLGPNYQAFKRRVKAHRKAKQSASGERDKALQLTARLRVSSNFVPSA
jgi:hypothetical protein